MYEHLQYFLEKNAALASPEAPKEPVVPEPPQISAGATGTTASFPQAAANNMNSGPAPPEAGPNRFNAVTGMSNTSAKGMNKLQSVRSVDDFTAKVRGPITDMRKEQYTSPFDEKPVEWGDPAAVEGGDAGTRWAPSGTTHPDVKIAMGRTRAALTAGKAFLKGLPKSRLGRTLSMASEVGETAVGAADTAGDIGQQLSRRLSPEDLAGRRAQGLRAGTPNPIGGLAQRMEARRSARRSWF